MFRSTNRSTIPQNPSIVSLRGRAAAVAILKLKVWHPVAKQGSTRREEIPITGTAKRAIPPNLLSPPHFQILVRSVSPCLVPGCQIVPLKIAASGAKNCALLAMTKSAGFAGNRTVFGTIRTKYLKNDAEQHCAERSHKEKTSVFQTKRFRFRVIARSAATRQSLSRRHGIPAMTEKPAGPAGFSTA